MAGILFTFIIVIFSPSIQLASSGSLRFEISPPKCIASLEQSVRFACLPDGAKDWKITSIQLSRKDQNPFVLIQQCGNISFAVDSTDKFQATGHIDEDPGKSYLNLTMLNPMSVDSSDYSCDVSYLDKAGHFKIETISGTLLVERMGVESLETVLNEMRKEISNLQGKPKNLNKEETRTSLKDEKQDSEITTLQNRISELEEKAKYTSAFFATNKGFIVVKKGDTVVFETVLMKHADGYDETSGVFTAPKAGLYAFHLYAFIGAADRGAELVLMVNDKRVANLYCRDQGYRDQSSVSVLVDLQAGDEVKVLVAATFGGSSFIQGFNLSGFSGYLIKQH